MKQFASGRLKIKLNNNQLLIIKGLALYFITRMLLLLITIITNSEAFLSYDDKFLYNTIIWDNSINISHYLKQRQLFILICSFINRYNVSTILTMPRILNLFLFFLMCCEIRKLCTYLEIEENFADIIFYVFLCIPYYIIYSASLYKDIAVAFLILKLFNIYFEYKLNKRINIIMALFVGILLYFMRFGILESLLLLIILNYMISEKKKIKYFIAIIAGILIIYFLYDNYIYWYVFEQKIEAYFKREVIDTGMLTLIRFRRIQDFYKIPALLIYVQLHPWVGSILAYLSKNSWAFIIGYTSFVQAFFLPYFWYYVLFNKKNKNEIGILIFYFLWIIILGISQPELSRFYYFLTPIYYIFSIKSYLRNKNKLFLYGFVCAILIILISIFRT